MSALAANPIEVGPLPARLPRAGLGASAGLHAAVIGLLLLAVPRVLPAIPPPQPIAVEIVSPAAYAAQTSPRPQVPAQPVPEAVPDRLPQGEPLAPAIPAPKTYTATTFYSAGVLASPGMERIRRTLTSFADSERVVQLCNIEGLEQIRRAAPQYDPDTLVGYAMADPVTHGLTLIARGGAFRSRRQWYGVSFSCTAAPGLDGVTAFTFQLGDAIPESEWEEHNLNAEDADE